MAKDGIKEKVEMGFMVALGIGLLIGAAWLSFRYSLITITILALSPIVAFWLWKFYQNKFTEKRVNEIFQGTIVLLIFPFLAMIGNSSKHEVWFEDVFLKGKERSAIVTEQNEETGKFEDEKKYYFILENKEDERKKTMISWFMGFLFLGSPIITLKFLDSLRPVHNEKEPKKSVRRYV